MITFAEQKEQKPHLEHYSFILFVISEGVNSEQAKHNLNRLCNKWLPERHTIKVVDVHDDFQTALEYNILVTPSVVVTSPEPQIIIHGDLSNADSFVDALSLKTGNDG